VYMLKTFTAITKQTEGQRIQEWLYPYKRKR